MSDGRGLFCWLVGDMEDINLTEQSKLKSGDQLHLEEYMFPGPCAGAQDLPVQVQAFKFKFQIAIASPKPDYIRPADQRLF